MIKTSRTTGAGFPAPSEKGNIVKEYFDTEKEAEEYRQAHELYARKVEYIPCRGKYALVFPIKALRNGSNDRKELEAK